MARLLQVSDTHLTAAGTAPEHPGDPEARLRAVIAEVSAHGPFDVVVVTGDVCDDGSAEGAHRVRELVDPLAPVVLGVPGNHDSTDVIVDVFGDPGEHPTQLGAWQITGAATNVAGQVGGIATPAVTALSALDQGVPTVLLMHHPLRSNSTHEWFNLPDAADLEALVEQRAAPLVLLSGHTHEPFESRTGTALVLGGPSTYYGIAHNGLEWTPADGLTGALVLDLGDDGGTSHRVVTA